MVRILDSTLKQIGQTGRVVDLDELRLIVAHLRRHQPARAAVEAV
jgi:hypothetical protein